MHTKELLIKSEALYHAMMQDIAEWEQHSEELPKELEELIIKIDEYIRALKNEVTNHLFETSAEEIYFFKKVKPRFIAEFIFYAERLSIETSKPHTSLKADRKYYEQLFLRIDRFNTENAEFIRYMKRNAEYLDRSYFCRRKYDLKLHVHEHLHSMDETFSTFQDSTLAKMLANDKLNLYLRKKLAEEAENSSVQRPPKASWTVSKVSLIELVYSLHITGSITYANGTLNDLIKYTERIMDVKLDNFYKILGEIKARKINRTKFLSNLQHTLDNHFLDEDAL